MRTRYALAALGLFCAPALVQAQNLDTIDIEGDITTENPDFPSTYVNPMLTITSSSNSDLDRVFFQGVDEEEAFQSPYVQPIDGPSNGGTAGTLVVGGSVYRCVVESASPSSCAPLGAELVDPIEIFDLAPPFFDGTVDDPLTGRTYNGTITGEVVVGDPVIGCDTDNNAPVVLDNADDVAGKIVLLARGSCGFSVKSTTAERSGAIAMMLYIPGAAPYAPYQYATLMAQTINGDGAANDSDLLFATDSLGLSIPSIIVPLGIAEPILDELDFGGEVMATIGPAPVNPFLDLDGDGNVDDPESTDPLIQDYYAIGETYGSLVDFLPIRGTLTPEGAAANSLGLISVDAEEPADLPVGEVAMKAFPNPFANTATVMLQTVQAEQVRVEVYNVLGQRVATLHDDIVSGQVELALDGSDLSAGLYLVRATGETFSQTTRVTVAR